MKRSPPGPTTNPPGPTAPPRYASMVLVRSSRDICWCEGGFGVGGGRGTPGVGVRDKEEEEGVPELGW